jgi:hypothetical protein
MLYMLMNQITYKKRREILMTLPVNMRQRVSLCYSLQRMINIIANIFYVLLNTICMILLAYQIYLWFHSGAWVKIATCVILPGQSTGWQFFSQGGLSTIWNWILNVELMYTLSIIAMIFYVVRFIPVKEGK